MTRKYKEALESIQYWKDVAAGKQDMAVGKQEEIKRLTLKNVEQSAELFGAKDQLWEREQQIQQLKDENTALLHNLVTATKELHRVQRILSVWSRDKEREHGKE